MDWLKVKNGGSEKKISERIHTHIHTKPIPLIAFGRAGKR